MGWGTGNAGQLGENSSLNRSSPVQVGTLVNWASVSAGRQHAVAIKTDGTLWAWGAQGGDGRLGLNDETSRLSPVQVGTLTTWASTASGSSHTVATRTDGTLWAWGSGSGGLLGLNNLINRSSPVQVGTLTNWARASAFGIGNFDGAIKTDGTLWMWGSNTSTELGVGDSIARSSPVQVGTLTDWSVLAVGSHAAAIKTDGTLWTWGPGLSGQLGHNNANRRSSPTQVGTFADWVAVACSTDHTVAVRTNGTLWSWGGNNLYGRLGQNDTLSRSSPTQVGTFTDWIDVSAGGLFTVARTSSGTLWTWGGNSDTLAGGQLGLGDRNSRSSPVQVGTLTNWMACEAGRYFTLGLQSP